MTLIRETCVEKACSRLSAKKHQLPVGGGLGQVGSVSPSGSRRRFGNEPIGVGCVRGMGVGLGVEIGVALVAVGVEEKR